MVDAAALEPARRANEQRMAAFWGEGEAR
jgi:hypothetical protein